MSRFASQGPAFDGTTKPELARSGSALAGGRLVSGAGVAAALVAADAARLREDDPQAARQRLLAATDTRPGARGATAAPPAVTVTGVRVRREAGATGVEFSVGTFRRGDPMAGRGTRIVPATRLDLTLVGSGGKAVERLTPTGGERDVLPGRYAYTLPARVVRRLGPGRYALPGPGPRAAAGRADRGALRGLRGQVTRVVLYGRPGCHLCEDARAAVLRVRDRLGPGAFELLELDIERDEDLLRRYLERIPVLTRGRRGAVRVLRGRGRAGGQAAALGRKLGPP